MSVARQNQPTGEGTTEPISTGEYRSIELQAIRLDQSAQPRESLNTERTAEYAEAMKAGDKFPSLVVFFDGETNWLADGFHRHYAAQQAGIKALSCRVLPGGLRDAILWSVGANAKHGLARSDEDKKRAVMRLLDDAEWSTWTDRDIAKRCHVSHPFVAKIRKGVTGNVSSERTYTTKHGTTATMKTAGINASRRNAPRPSTSDEPYPEASPQADASSAGREVRLPADREGHHEGEAASVDLPTISRNIVAEFCTLWSEATQSERDEIRAIINSASDGGPEGRKRLQVAREPINAAEPDVLAATREGLSMERGIDQCVTAGETAQISQSGDDAFSEVKGAARPENAAGVEPSSSDNPSTAPTVEPEATPSPPNASGNPINPDPHTPGRATAAPANQVSQPPAQNDGAPLTVGQGGHGPVDHCGHAKQEPAVEPQGRNEPVSGEAASVTNLNPRCQKPDTCKWAHSQVSCSACANAWTKRSAAA